MKGLLNMTGLGDHCLHFLKVKLRIVEKRNQVRMLQKADGMLYMGYGRVVCVRDDKAGNLVNLSVPRRNVVFYFINRIF